MTSILEKSKRTLAPYPLPPGEDPLQALVRRGCLRRAPKTSGQDAAEEPSAPPTRLAALGCQPERWLTSAGILMARFSRYNTR